MTALHVAYALNLLILAPVAVPTLLGWYEVAQGAFEESAGYRGLVGALWTAILVGSVLGLHAPLRMSPVLLLQVIYKTLWLVTYALPRAWRGEWSRVPRGITVSFVGIVAVWPWLIPWAALAREVKE